MQNVLLDPIEQLFAWSERNDQARTVPDYLLQRAEHQHTAECNHVAGAGIPKDEIKKNLESHASNRAVARAIANKINNDYPKIADRLRACHRNAVLFMRNQPDGPPRREYIWDYKCGLKKLCPHCAHDAQRYFIDRYVEPINDWKRIDKKNQIQYAVLTTPNINAGELKKMKKQLFKRLNNWLARDVCKSVKGSLVVMEDPLSNDKKFNVHFNLVLLVHGPFDWSAARAAWFDCTMDLFERCYSGFNCYFKEITHCDIKKTVLELVKYSAKHITAKDSDAPGLLDWTQQQFNEWWSSQQNFRRVRSYGVLHSLHVYMWDRILTEAQRRQALEKIGAPVKYWFYKFRKITKEIREQLKDLIIPPKPPADFSDGEFVGRVMYNRQTGSYDFFYCAPGAIDLILGHKSGLKNRNQGIDDQWSHHDPP